jgi:spermidine/putrescine-binding protein
MKSGIIQPGKINGFIFILLTLVSGSGIAEATPDQQILRVAGWDVYADPEQRNKTIGYKKFEEQTGFTIEFTPLSNLDAIIHYAESSKDVDVLIISNEGISVLYKMALVQPLDLTKIPNYQDLHPGLRYSNWSQFDGGVYAVPWAWGPTGLLYDSEKMAEPDSWNIFWDQKYKGKVSLWNDVSMIWTAALALGYTNVYNLTSAQLDEVKKKLLQLNEQVYTYYSGEQDEMELLSTGKVVIANSWFDPSARLSKYNKQFKMVIPKEGAVGMFDSYLLSHNCKLKEISHNFINHQISPEVQLKMSRATGLAPSNIETLAFMSQLEIKALHLDDQNYFRKMLLWDVMPRKHLYERLMQEVKRDQEKRKTGTN